MVNKNIILHLSLIENIGPATIDRLVSVLSVSKLNNIYDMAVDDLVQYMPEQIAQKIYDGLKDKSVLEKELNIAEQNNIEIISIYDESYPQILKNIYMPPSILYVSGDISKLKEKIGVAIVGSRKADSYGQRVVKIIGQPLAQEGFALVSGGAFGIDTLVHNVALEENGYTVSVLGAGLLKVYPTSNADLFKKIVYQGGALVSPFPLNTIAKPMNFPIRNRIISGLSHACIVVQAAEGSGALITAQYALEQGREIGAVPGPINSELSFGCHKLISQGAAIITNSNDVKALLPEYLGVLPRNTGFQQNFLDNKPKTLKDEILDFLGESSSFDDILAKFSIEAVELQELLWKMQLDGRIEQNLMGFWKTKLFQI